MKLFGSITELVAAVFRKNSQAITVRPNQATTYTAARDVQLPPQDADAVIVSESATQPLTNKTIDADLNTLSNIENADIKAGAAIDATKIADGSVSNAEFQALNGVSGTLVDTTSVQTLSNKSLVDASTSIVDDGDATKILKFQVSGISTGTTRTLTVPDASDTVAVLATAQTLTNKTIDADQNTITNIENADIKSGAAIDAAKLADGSVDNTEFQRLGTAGTAGAGNLVTTDGTQVVTNKDIDGGTASNSRRITVPKDTVANLTALTRKQGTILYGSDTNILYRDDGSSLAPVGQGSATLAVNIRASEGAGTTTLTSADQHIQRFNLTADRTVVLPSTGVSAGDLWEMINPNPYSLTIEADDNSSIVNSWGDQISLVALISTPATNSDWAVVDKSILYGRVPQGYTPSFNGVGTITTEVFSWWREGGNLMIKGTFTVDTPSGAAAAEVGLPQPGSGLNIDTTNLVNNSSSFGDWHQLGNGANPVFASTLGGVCYYSGGAGTQFVRLAYQVSSNTYTTDVANGFLTATFPLDVGVLVIPIAEWAE